MEEIRIERLTEDHFHLHSLDNFIRHQIVKECWRKVDGQWVLLPIAFVEEWSLEKKRLKLSVISTERWSIMELFKGKICLDI